MTYELIETSKGTLANTIFSADEKINDYRSFFDRMQGGPRQLPHRPRPTRHLPHRRPHPLHPHAPLPPARLSMQELETIRHQIESIDWSAQICRIRQSVSSEL